MAKKKKKALKLLNNTQNFHSKLAAISLTALNPFATNKHFYSQCTTIPQNCSIKTPHNNQTPDLARVNQGQPEPPTATQCLPQHTVWDE
jgi:hypothetical protein